MPAVATRQPDMQAPEGYFGRPSHVVEDRGNKVLIKDLEVFVGYDPDVDGNDRRFKRYDDDEITRIVETTNKHSSRNERPKLILRHTSDDPEAPDRPVVGDFINGLHKRDVNGVPGIVGDVLMSRDDFDTYIKSNRYPRRSAEIHADGHMSEVALLGSETPARPLPDLHFSERDQVMRFSRAFWFSMNDASPGNVHPPKGTKMADSDKKDEQITKLQEEIKDLKAKLKSKNAEDDEAKKHAESGDDKEKEKAMKQRFEKIERERDEFKTAFSKQQEELAELRSDLKREKFNAKLRAAKAEGYDFGDAEREGELLDRVVAAKDPEAEFEFFRKGAPQIPLNQNVARHARLPQNDTELSEEQQNKARQVAVDRCTKDSKLKFSEVYADELEKAKKG